MHIEQTSLPCSPDEKLSGKEAEKSPLLLEEDGLSTIRDAEKERRASAATIETSLDEKPFPWKLFIFVYIGLFLAISV